MEFCELRQFSFVPANAAGIAPYEKFRFEIGGIHRRFAFRGGEYVDAYSDGQRSGVRRLWLIPHPGWR